jgi:hypothetical protein
MPTTNEVFGIRVEPVLSYVTRDDVDDRFTTALATDHHIVVYGSSKQGKTSLRQKLLPDNRCITVRCAPNMTTGSLYSSILRQTDVKIQTIESKDSTIEGKITTKVGFKALIPWFGGGEAEATAEAGGSKQMGLTTEFVAFDFSEAQSIGELLAKIKFNKFIVLENFHYLSPETQLQLAFDLKTFHEIRIRFIILGIWWEANHLLAYNGDLQDRLIEVPVEPWDGDDFKRIAAEGSRLLNITIHDSVIDNFIANSYGNVGMFQEFLKTFCEIYGVKETTNGWILRDGEHVTDTLKTKIDSQRGQLLKTLQVIAANSRVRSNEGDPLLLPYYLAIAICTTEIDALKDGLDKNRLLQLLREVHHRIDKETIRIGDVTNLLTRIPAIQEGIQPPFLYYDSVNRRLKIVDTRHFFVLANINRSELAEDIPYPRES